MSQLLGFLQLSGRGGNELFVYDDCLVRASTGLLAAVTADKPLNLAALSGDLEEYRTMPPAQLVMQHPDNRMVRRLDVREATLARGRWPATGLRRLTPATLGDRVVGSGAYNNCCRQGQQLL
ncbi:MAG: hypothetical protein JWO27_1374 [Frankiales bacterium]|nr:hypothetical protein [Frankiales bacterium]